MKLTLQVDGALHPVTLTEEGLTIGRGEQATIRIQANAVSRVHARIFLKDGRPHVADMKSLNGTSLNGTILAEPLPLNPGDKVLLGEVLVMWVGEETSGPTLQGLNQTLAPRAAVSKISLEDRAFDASGSILVPHASLEAMLAQASGQHPAGEAVTLFQRLASMAGTLLRAAGLPELLESVMGLVTAQIPCQRGFILLADAAGELVPELVWEEQPGQHTAPISRTIARTAMKDRVAILTTDARMDPRFSAGESIKIHGISSALCAPLIVENQAFGVVYLETSLSKGGFKREDEHLLSAMANFAAVGIQREREANFRRRLERYHSPAVVDQILKSSQSKEAPALQAQRCEISVLFADISGFTRMSEGMEPLVLAAILNRTFEALTDQIFLRGGTLDKYIGDALMAFFGAPNPDPDHARHAVEAAAAMQATLHALNAARPDGYPELRMRIGINSGEAFAGDIGCEKRMDYTVMGSTVNLASRLESGVAKPGQIVVGPRTAELVGVGQLRPLEGFALKGIEHEVRPFEVRWDDAGGTS
ncbi:adenylate/guanylate cyclase domain-containing protein [Geothrix sp. 21YS21S-4]|uniref:adenylate/guanylate cyclase domain-containing protein n=1 Tax=Geothrix sp. 21YS21S-4 TaxID=3068889 RepID=UPI0027BAD478|nr:adenylate/guanylate cyclase domain-containing protein [Geothrix sp. 21YS21S-4]